MRATLDHAQTLDIIDGDIGTNASDPIPHGALRDRRSMICSFHCLLVGISGFPKSLTLFATSCSALELLTDAMLATFGRGAIAHLWE